MNLIYDNKKIKLINCISFKDRLLGFMFKKNADYALVFPKCNSIHTFFMKMNIDVIMCDNDNNILYVYNNLRPNKVILPKRKVKKVIEVPSNIYNFRINTKIKTK